MAERSRSIGIRFPTSLIVREKPAFGGELFDGCSFGFADRPFRAAREDHPVPQLPSLLDVSLLPGDAWRESEFLWIAFGP